MKSENLFFALIIILSVWIGIATTKKDEKNEKVETTVNSASTEAITYYKMGYYAGGANVLLHDVFDIETFRLDVEDVTLNLEEK